MTKITGFTCTGESGEQIACDAFGNNVAFCCPKCQHPVLAIAREHQRGFSKDTPTKCPGCDLVLWIEILEEQGSLKARWVT